MHKIKFRLAVLSLALLSSACTYIDDYAFGKDNTPKPKPLPKIQEKHVLHVDWSKSIGEFNAKSLTADLKPKVYASKVYVASSKGQITALKAKTGQILWQVNTHLNFLAGPIVSKDDLILTSDDSALYIFDRNTGAQKQRISLANDVLAQPLLHGRMLYVKTISGVVSAIDLNTGKKVWSYRHPSPEIILKASSSPVIYQNNLVLGFSDGSLLFLDLYKGTLVSQQHLAYPRGASDVERLVDIDTNPILDGSKLYLASYQGEIAAYSLENMSFIWQRRASTYHDLALDQTAIYMVDSHDNIWAFDKNNATVLWKQNGLKARGLTAPVVWKNILWVADSQGVVHGINPKTGQFISQLNLKSAVISAPVNDQDASLVITRNGQLHRLSLSK